MTVSWIINFKSIQHGNTVVRRRKHLSDPIFSSMYGSHSAGPSWDGGSCSH